MTAVTVAALAFVVLAGRNDGAPLVAMGLHTARAHGAWAFLAVVGAPAGHAA
jgi:hypothetical protein